MTDKKNDFFTTREDLKDYIHDIHNFIRNNGAGYGKKGMTIFNIFYGLKLIQPFLDKIKLSKEQKDILNFKNLIKKVKNDDLITKYIDDDILGILAELKNSKDDELKVIGKFMFYEIPKNLTDNFWRELIKKIDLIPVGYTEGSNVNLSGKVYEYFVGRDKSAITELGAYFTDRHITEFLIESKVQPQLDENDNIFSSIDPFGGSGGFTLGLANYYRKNFNNINWKNNVNHIHHFDMDEDVVNMTGLEMFAITGILPKVNDKNYKRVNSFEHEFNDEKYDFVFSNPPYGGDKNNDSAVQLRRNAIINEMKNKLSPIKLKDNEQYKQLIQETKKYREETDHKVTLSTCSQRINEFAKKYNLTSNDKEGCSWILLMDLVAENGTCCAVLKEGVFFDNAYSDIRKVLIENYNITNIVSIPADAFESTTTKTSAIIFKNNGPTKKIQFSELIIEKAKTNIVEVDDKGIFYVVNLKDEITSVIEKNTSTATFKELTKPTIIKDRKGDDKERFDYSLNYKDYLNEVVYCPEGYELKKLGDICVIKRGSRITDNIIKYDSKDSINKYKIYGAGSCQGYTDKFNRSGENCILSRVGSNTSKNCCKIEYENFLLSDAGFTLENFKNDLIKRYIFNYLLKNYDFIFTTNSSGSVQLTISGEVLSNYQIPIPKDITKLKPQLDKIHKLHQQISDDTELIPQKEKEICELIKKMVNEGKKGVDYEEKKLGEIIEFQQKKKKYKASDGKLEGKYKFYTSSQNKILFIDDEPLFNETMLIMGRNGEMSVHYDKNFSCEHDHVYVIKTKIDTRYIYYYINNNRKWFENQMNGSTIKGTSKEILNKFIIQIPSETTMKKYKFEDLFNEIDQLKERLETNKKEHEKEVAKLMEPFNEDNVIEKTKPNKENVLQNLLDELINILKCKKYVGSNIKLSQVKINNKIKEFISNYFNDIKFVKNDRDNIKQIINYLELIDDTYNIGFYSQFYDPLTDKTKELFLNKFKLLLADLKTNFNDIKPKHIEI